MSTCTVRAEQYPHYPVTLCCSASVPGLPTGREETPASVGWSGELSLARCSPIRTTASSRRHPCILRHRRAPRSACRAAPPTSFVAVQVSKLVDADTTTHIFAAVDGRSRACLPPRTPSLIPVSSDFRRSSSKTTPPWVTPRSVPGVNQNRLLLTP